MTIDLMTVWKWSTYFRMSHYT